MNKRNILYQLNQPLTNSTTPKGHVMQVVTGGQALGHKQLAPGGSLKNSGALKKGIQCLKFGIGLGYIPKTSGISPRVD